MLAGEKKQHRRIEESKIMVSRAAVDAAGGG